MQVYPAWAHHHVYCLVAVCTCYECPKAAASPVGAALGTTPELEALEARMKAELEGMAATHKAEMDAMATNEQELAEEVSRLQADKRELEDQILEIQGKQREQNEKEKKALMVEAETERKQVQSSPSLARPSLARMHTPPPLMLVRL